MSLLARFNYNYKQRYYLTVTGRYDGSSNFAANNKWGFFPSVALKWNAAKENFLKDVRWIDELSLRLSAGRTGNDAISAYRSLAAMSSTTSGYLFDGMQPGAYYRSRLASPNLTWEKTDLYNAALDLAFFNNRLRVAADYYSKKSEDLLFDVSLPDTSGYGSVRCACSKLYAFSVWKRKPGYIRHLPRNCSARCRKCRRRRRLRSTRAVPTA